MHLLFLLYESLVKAHLAKAARLPDGDSRDPLDGDDGDALPARVDIGVGMGDSFRAQTATKETSCSFSPQFSGFEDGMHFLSDGPLMPPCPRVVARAGPGHCLVATRHATGVRQGNWISVGMGPVPTATQ